MNAPARPDRTQSSLTVASGPTSLTEAGTARGAGGDSRHAPTRRSWHRLQRTARHASARTRALLTFLGSVVTSTGWATVVVGTFALAVGWYAHWTEFLLLGLTLTILVLTCLTFLLGQASYEVELYTKADRTVVGSPVTAGVRLADRGRRPLWGSRVEVQLGDGAIELRLPPRKAGGTAGSEFPVPADRRGVIVVGPVRTVQGDPVGLFRRQKVWTQSVDVHIHPATITLPSTSTGLIRDLEGNPTKDLTVSDISFHALREFRPGDERRHINWKATARTGQLTVRQFEETRRSHIVVAFSLSAQDYAREDEFELAISAATSIGLRAIRDGRELTVVTSPRKTPSGEPPARAPRALASRSRTQLLDASSEVLWADADIGLGDLALLASGTLPGISIMFLLCGSAPSLRDLRSWSLRFPAGVEVVVVVCEPQASPALRRISELSVLSIGYLDDLKSALNRSAST